MNGSHIPRRGHQRVALAALLVATAVSAPAADRYWSGTGTWDTTTATWGTAPGGPYDAATWSNATPDAAFFEGTAGTVTLGGPITAAGLTFSTTGYTVTGNTLTLSGGTTTIALGSGVSGTIGSTIAGSSVFEKTGAGTLTLTSANTFSSNVIVGAGTIRLGSVGALGPSNTAVTKVTVNSGGTVDLNGTTDPVYGYTISGSGADGTGAIVNTGAGIGNFTAQTTNIRLAADAAIGGSGNWALLTFGFNPTSLDLAGFTLTKVGSNTISLCNTTATSGTIRIAAGTLSQTQRDNSVAGVAFTLDNVSGATLQLDDRSMTIGSLAGGGSTGGNVSLGGNTLTTGGLNTSTTYSGAIGGSGGLVKTGTGTLTLDGVNTYTGTTTVNSGTLQFGSGGTTGGLPSPAISIASGANFTVNRSDGVAFGSLISGSGSVTNLGSGTVTLSNANTYSGGTLLSAGVLALDSNSALGTGTLTFAGGAIRPTANRAVSNAIVAAASTSSNLIDAGTGDLMYTGTATGSGTLIANSTTSRSMWLQGDWSGFSGQLTFTVNGGGTNYRLGGTPGATSSNTGTNGSDFNQATFVLSGTGADRGLSWNGAQGATVRVGTLSGTGGRIISGADGRDANWQVGGLNQTSSAAVVIEGNATSLTKVGTGTLTLTGSSTYSGGTTVSAGTLDLDAASAVGAGSLTIAAGASVNALRAFAISTDAAAAGRVVNVAGFLSMADSEYVQTYNLTAGTINAPTTGNRFLRAPTVGLTINSLAAATSSQITGQFDLTFNSATLNVADGAAVDDLVISGNISQNEGAGSGAKSITKTGAGTLLLSGTNSYSGGTVINAGLVKAGSSRALGAENSAASAVTIASGATLDINRVTGNTGDFFYGMTIAGSGTAGQGALINTGANGGSSLRQTPNITLSADATIGGSGNILMINSGFAANSLNLAGNTLTKTGTNTLFLANTTVTAGTIDIQQGTLSHFQTAANASAAAITMANAAGATLALNNLGLQVGSLAGGGSTGGNVTLGSATLTLGGRNETTSFGGAISGTGAVVKTGTGTQTFAAANSYSGGTTISAGTLVAGNANAFGTTGAISVGASGTLGVGDGVTFTRPFSLTAGGRVRTGNNSTVSLPSVAALAAWESQSGSGDQTLAEILDASGSITPTALFSAWTANPDSSRYLSDILTLEGTGLGNTYVLSMDYAAASDNLNIWYRANVGDPFTPLGTSFQGNVPWSSGFAAVGQYGVDTSAGTVWVVTNHNSQFVIVPEPGTLGLLAAGLAAAVCYRHRRRAGRH